MTTELQGRKSMLSRLKADRRRLVLLHSQWNIRSGIFHPSFLCVLLSRIAHRFLQNGHPLLARIVAQFNQLLTGADINPASEIDEGLVILTPPGAALYGKAGCNLTVMPCAGIGGELGRREDVGGGPGLPVLGDDVILEPHCGVLGPIKVGSRVRVGAGALVLRDVPDDTIVEGPRPRLLAQRHPK
jgi:serine O-acetyltransferase